MLRIKLSTVFTLGAVSVFAIVSKAVFDKVYLTSHEVIDEEFHLPLGKAYCNFEFDKWHPKVTTFPGLYLLSTLLFGVFELCSTYWLRLTSLLFSFINIILFYYLLNIYNESPSWQNVISAINLSLLPPLYFFSHLYYTDVASLTMILILLLLSQKDYHFLASIFGMASILFRQTNIVWVGMVCAGYIVQELNKIQHNKSRKSRQGVSPKELIQLLKTIKITMKKTTINFWLNVFCYLSLLIVFLLFIYLNGSIVVGDKLAHKVTLHIPQLFYFSLFCLFFAWPYFIAEISSFLKFAFNHKLLTLFALTLSLVIVYSNTLVHPYLLADNRHYVFYIWNRFYGKYFLFRFIIIPVYLFAWFVIVKKMLNKDVSFLLFFIPCTSLVLVTQKLLEVRYFFIPYVLFRLRLKNVSANSLLFEFLTSFVINVYTFYLFFTKSIEWIDYDYPQRLIW